MRPRVPRSVLLRRRPAQLRGMGALEGDPLIWWPGAIADLIRQVDGEIQAISKDVTAAWANGQLSSVQRGPWKSFYDEWMGYKADASTWTGATVSRVRTYQSRAIALRAQLGNLGVTFTAPPPTQPPSTGPFGLPSWVLPVAAVAGVVALVGHLAGPVKALLPRGDR